MGRLGVASVLAVACNGGGGGAAGETSSASTSGSASDSTSGSASGSSSAASSETTSVADSSSTGDAPIYDVGGVLDLGTSDCTSCSSDMHTVIDCMGNPLVTCGDDEACDLTTGGCSAACVAASHNASAVGCEYWATKMDHSSTYDALGVCLAAFVANTWTSPVTIEVEYDGMMLPVEDFTRVPQGEGPGLTLEPYDAAVGLPPGEVAIIFLSGPTGAQEYGKEPCPIAPAIAPEVMVPGTAIGRSFRIATDVPVVAYQMNPYGAGAGGAVAGASLLLPTSTWDTNYVAANAYQADLSGEWPSMNIIATEDDTTVTMLPVANVEGGGGVPSGAAGVALDIVLQRGEHAQLTQEAELTGSVLQSDKPIGLMAGHNALRVPVGVSYADHAEQMIPPVRALGSEYVGVMHLPRGGEPAVWRLVGAVDGTTLDWSSDVGGPATLERGQIAELVTGEPFVVASQDEEHPFMLFTYMSGSQWSMIGGAGVGAGDADFVLGIP
ncbi:MAG TPA: IgGFc-binding protein, partial [Nannocystaceae bacterium]|nr:IgGFc-binding protein [Nannocystaceae bacterium]